MSVMEVHGTAGVDMHAVTVKLGSRTILRSVSHSFTASSVTAILGPNGAGKTTLLRTVMGLIHPVAGRVTVGGHVAGSPASKRLVGYLPERPGVYERLSGRQNLVFHAKMRGLDSSFYYKEVDKLLKQFGLSDVSENQVATYSKGMKQRLALARTFMDSPRVVLLDEPTSGLDPDGSVEVTRLIQDKAREGCTILLSTHNPYFARQVCQELVLLRLGELVREGKFDSVLAPYSRLTVRLLKPVEVATLPGLLDGYTLTFDHERVTDHFIIGLSSKEEVPEFIRVAVNAGLDIVEIEPAELTYFADRDSQKGKGEENA